MRILILASLLVWTLSNDLRAAYFRDGSWLAENGVFESIQIEPALPAPGEGFTIRIAGSWPEKSPDGFCFRPPEIDQVVVHAGNRVQVISNLYHDPDLCDQPLVPWNLEAEISASAWDAVNEEGFLQFEHLMFSGINMLTGINRVFDFRLGTHQVPAFLGSGFWISAERPYEGVMIEQQGARVLFYSLEYDRDESMGDDGEPVWLMFTGDMTGNSTLARTYRYDWPVGDDAMPGEIPSHDELLTVNDSGAIIVNDYNHIRVLTGVVNNVAKYQDFIRYFFGRDPSRSPVYVPPLDGRWTLQGFDGQDSMFTASLELLESTSPAANQYRFDSPEGDWQVLCTIVLPGNGNCSVEHSEDGTKFDFPLSAFQGNLARGSLMQKDGTLLDGVLVRFPYQLPTSMP